MIVDRVPPLPAFSIGRLPRIEFGPGRFELLPEIVARYGGRALVVTGSRSLRASGRWGQLRDGFDRAGVSLEELQVAGEPSPELVDEAVARFHGRDVDVVVGIGGGSALDTAKAVAGLLLLGSSVLDHLEGVGRGLPYRGPAVPFVAVPTTAGTGSEATRNAVLSVAGGFKKSFRDERLVAQDAVVDPDLLATCPPTLIASDGMDALTQLIESYVASGANPFTDALALSGLEAARDGLLAWYEAACAGGAGKKTGAGAPGGDAAAAAPARMAYAALCSGITLAQAGLGAAHGLASPLGAFFPIPHGAACGAVLVAATRVNIAALEAREPGRPALPRYARLGRLLTGRDDLDDASARDALVTGLAGWTERLQIRGLADFGVHDADVPRIVADARGSSMRTNPVVLADEEIAGIVRASL